MEKNKILSDAFMWLFIGLLTCFGISYVTTLDMNVFASIYGAFGGYSYLIFAILEIVLAIVLSVRITKMKPTTAKLLYIAYCILTGLSLTGIFVVYTASSLTFVFLATAIIFGIFAFIGKTTKVDLSKWYIFLFVALIAIIILEIINIFLMNNTLNMILCIISILVFSAYTAYDVQSALNKSYLANCENKGIYCAFQLFLDFINLFMDLLRLFGKSKD